MILIVSKPKTGALFSLGSFIVITLGLAIYISSHMLQEVQTAWYQYALVILLYPIGIGLTIKVIWGYKIVSIAKDKIDIWFPTRFNALSYRIKDIGHWKETTIKTATGMYKEIKINFKDKKQVSLSYQEHTNYPKVVKYLKKKCSNKLIT